MKKTLFLILCVLFTAQISLAQSDKPSFTVGIGYPNPTIYGEIDIKNVGGIGVEIFESGSDNRKGFDWTKESDHLVITPQLQRSHNKWQGIGVYYKTKPFNDYSLTFGVGGVKRTNYFNLCLSDPGNERYVYNLSDKTDNKMFLSIGATKTLPFIWHEIEIKLQTRVLTNGDFYPTVGVGIKL